MASQEAFPGETGELRFHSLILSQVNDAVLAVDAAGIVTYMNQSAERMYGAAVERVLGRPLADLYRYRWLAPGDEEQAGEALRAYGFWRGENLHVLHDGRVLHVESSVSTLTGDEGKPAGLLAVIRDVTDARRVEAALRDREARYRGLFEAIDEGFCIIEVLFDGDGRAVDYRFVETNDAFDQQSGVRDVVGRTIREVVPGLEPIWLERYGSVVHTGQSIRFVERAATLDRWFEVFAFRVGALDERQVAVLFKDLTERTRAARAMAELESRRRMALDAAELGTWRHDLATNQVELDTRARAHYGLDGSLVTADEIVARVHPEDRGALVEAMTASLDPEVKRPVAAEYRVVLPNGGIRWLSINGHVSFEPADGLTRPTVGIGTTRDITDSKRAEAELREADRRKDEFLAILAHELRNPLAPIRTAVGILRAPGVADAVAQRARDIIDRQVAQMARLVDDLLDVSRLSRGHLSLQRRPVRVEEVLELAIETARPLIEAQRHRLDVHGPPRPILLDADLARLAQVFANLLNNAARYTPPGGLLTVRVAEDAAGVAVEVEDTGVGIAAEHVEQIFELFARGDPSRGSGGGLGIGLALSRRLVELHGGRLTASSPGPGRGSTFTATLPVHHALDAPAPVPEAPDGRAAPRVPRRVLVVDDNMDAADTTALFLTASGYTVRTAYGGEQALRELADFHPEVVLLDIGMPGMDGFETCRRIRDLPGGRDVLIAAVTGWGQDESRRQTRLAGFEAHLVKPVAPETVLQLVESRRTGGGAH
jgi:PAS domain S-box-containing protein